MDFGFEFGSNFEIPVALLVPSVGFVVVAAVGDDGGDGFVAGIFRLISRLLGQFVVALPPLLQALRPLPHRLHWAIAGAMGLGKSFGSLAIVLS